MNRQDNLHAQWEALQTHLMSQNPQLYHKALVLGEGALLKAYQHYLESVADIPHSLQELLIA
jgi:hypothetical protein